MNVYVNVKSSVSRGSELKEVVEVMVTQVKTVLEVKEGIGKVEDLKVKSE